MRGRLESKTRPLLGSFFQQAVQQTPPRVPGLHFAELRPLRFPLTLAFLKLQDSVAQFFQFFRRQRLNLFPNGFSLRAHALNFTRCA